MMRDQADVVVAGGGIIGAAAAFALAREKLDVVLLERGALAGGASGNSFAWINATAKTTDIDYHRLNATGVDAYHAFAAEHGAGAIGLFGHGDLRWAEPADPESMEHMDRTAGRLGELGYPVERVDRRGLAELAPDVRFAEGARGLLAPRDRCLDVPRAVRFLTDRVRDLGGRVIEHTPVNGFTRAGGRVATVETYGGSIATHHAVIAAGAATPRLAALAASGAPALPVDRVRGLLVDVPPDVVSHRLAHTVHTPERGGLHFRPRADGGLMICAEDTAGPLAGVEDVNDAIALKADLLRRAQAFLPALDGEAIGRRATARIGVRPMPGDGHSIVGWVPGADGVIAVVTHSGVTLGLVLGRLIAEAVMDGRMPRRLARYGLDRF